MEKKEEIFLGFLTQEMLVKLAVDSSRKVELHFASFVIRSSFVATARAAKRACCVPGYNAQRVECVEQTLLHSAQRDVDVSSSTSCLQQVKDQVQL